tara:strand:+ start:15150 stop:15344 length:195 start_codon:yes stop_codon:yes gene_type:complete
MTFIPKKPAQDEMWQRIKNQDIYRQIIEAIPADKREEVEKAVKQTVLPLANGLLASMAASKNKK